MAGDITFYGEVLQPNRQYINGGISTTFKGLYTLIFYHRTRIISALNQR